MGGDILYFRELVSKKLNDSEEDEKKRIFTPTGCEERYSHLLQLAETHLIKGSNKPPPLPPFIKREFVIKTISHGKLYSGT